MIAKQRKTKIIWQCRRGLLELDIIFENILTHHIDTMSEAEITSFEQLLTQQDAYLYAWLMGFETPKDKETQDGVNFIISKYQSDTV